LTALLDVNMLIALLDAAHVHHARARSWLMSQPHPIWASCPITQNGFIRIISQSAYPGSISTAQAFSVLGSAANTPYHRFWPDDVSLLESSLIDPNFVHRPKQVTDIYLLALAVKHDGRLGNCWPTDSEVFPRVKR